MRKTMLVTKKYIQELREESFLNISNEQEKLILKKLGKGFEADEDGHYYEYTEQDILEQIRKMIRN
jgi:hypothetical protein